MLFHKVSWGWSSQPMTGVISLFVCAGTTRSSASDEALAELAEARAQAAAATAPPQEGDGSAEAAGDAAERAEGALDQGADAVGERPMYQPTRQVVV